MSVARIALGDLGTGNLNALWDEARFNARAVAQLRVSSSNRGGNISPSLPPSCVWLLFFSSLPVSPRLSLNLSPSLASDFAYKAQVPTGEFKTNVIHSVYHPIESQKRGGAGAITAAATGSGQAPATAAGDKKRAEQKSATGRKGEHKEQ